jgi:uncharacterized membrane protein YczE
VPVTRWRANSRWRARPTTLLILFVGLWLFGTGEGLLVVAGLGVSPWTVFAQGLSVQLPISIGLATFLTSALVLLLWVPLREKPGLGTIANAVVIALALQVTVWLVPDQTNWWLALIMVLFGILIIGLGSGMYLTTNLGPGPRDGWMTGIHQRTGWPVVWVRLAIEVTALSLGWALGGTVGLGTLLFAVLIGPSVGYGLKLAGAVGALPGRSNRS